MSYMNTVMPVGRVRVPGIEPVTQNTSPAAPEADAPISTSGAIGPYAMFMSMDGDSVQISDRARSLSYAPPSQRPAVPEAMPGNAFSEITSAGILETLKPEGECQTCKNRKYVDKSDDASVSFQTPTSVNPNMSTAAVASHENEHVRNEKANAARDGREIVNQTVTMTYAFCPECGKLYASGGTTRTTSISKSDDGDMFSEEKMSPESDAA